MKDYPLFLITVDVEADDAWDSPEKIELKNLAELPRFHDICAEYSAIPTYLVTYECATRDEAISILKPIADAGNCEIGHHLHCWTTPPFQREGSAGVDAAWVHAYQSELPDSLFSEKADTLYTAIEKAYGRRSRSHRAGRWGIDRRSIDWLIENGFRVDSSVVPFMSYLGNAGIKGGGPSFYSSPLKPYIYRRQLGVGYDNDSLMEIPVTIDIPESFIMRACMGYMKRGLPGRIILDRLFRRAGGVRMLRLDPACPVEKLLRMIDKVIKANVPVVNLMLHSSELALGCSPFSRTKDDCANVWQKLEAVFKHVTRRRLTATSLSGATKLLPHNTP